jgi:acetylglutamate kinase
VSLVVVKVGGNAAPSAARAVADLVFQEHKVVLVHGAGPQITAEMERRGLAVEFVGGRRRTSAAALDVVRRSLAEVNAALCAAIGPRALPLPGGALNARPLAGLGLVGEPVPSAPPHVVDALAAGLVPVVAPLARDPGGRPLNVNGDDAAVALALGLGADRIVFLSDVPGVLLEGAVTPELGVSEAERLADAWEGGIVPKLLAAARAARNGVAAEIGATSITAAAVSA